MKQQHFVLIGICLLIIVSLFVAGCETSTSNNLFNKTSRFTLDDCNKICDLNYDLQIQVDICQSDCAMYGKESPSMDKFCLSLIKNHNQKLNNS